MENEGTDHQTKERLRTRWTASLDQVFADLVVEQIKSGSRRNGVFDKKTWVHIRNEFHKQTGLSFRTSQLRKHLDLLRMRYNQTMAEALLDMIAASKIRTVGLGSNQEEFFITNCIRVLDEIKGIGE